MPQEINSETTENKMNNEEQEMYRAAETLSLQEQDLLHEVSRNKPFYIEKKFLTTRFVTFKFILSADHDISADQRSG